MNRTSAKRVDKNQSLRSRLATRVTAAIAVFAAALSPPREAGAQSSVVLELQSLAELSEGEGDFSELRFVAFTAAATADVPNTSAPGVTRAYLGTLFVADREEGRGPQRMVDPSGPLVVSDGRFDEVSVLLSRLAFIRRDAASPKDKSKETLWLANVLP